MRIPRLRRLAQPVRCAFLSGSDSVHHLRSRSGVPVPMGSQRVLARLGRVGRDDGFYCRIGARPDLCLDKGSAEMGVELSKPAGGASIMLPDKDSFKHLNG